MHDRRVVDPPRYLLQQDVMPNVVEVCAQIEVENPRLLLHDRLCDSLHRFMCRPLRSIPIRPRLKVSLKDGLQNELARSLDHAVADCGNREHTQACAAALRNY